MGCDPRSVLVRFVVDRVALGEISLRLLRFSAVNLAVTKDKQAKPGRRQSNALSQIKKNRMVKYFP